MQVTSSSFHAAPRNLHLEESAAVALLLTAILVGRIE